MQALKVLLRITRLLLLSQGMEALLILLAEFLLAPFIAFLTLTVEFLLALLTFVLELIVGLFSGARNKEEKVAKEPAISGGKQSRTLHIIRNFSLALFSVSIAGLLAVQLFAYESALTWVAERVSKRTGMTISFASAEGNLFFGSARLKDISISRDDHPESIFALSIREAAVDLDLFSLLGTTSSIEEVSVSGLSGEFKRLSIPSSVKKRTAYVIEELEVNDSELNLTLPTKEGEHADLPVQIESLYAKPLRSDKAVFDLLFRTSFRGRLAEAPVRIETEEVKEGRETSWKVSDLSLPNVSPFLPKPLSWAEGGTLNVDVTDRWALGEGVDIDMEWNVVVSDAEVVIPENTSKMSMMFALPIVALINRVETIPVSFSLTINKDEFNGSASVETLSLWTQASDLLLKQLGKFTNTSPEKMKELGVSGIEKFKGYLDKRRKE